MNIKDILQNFVSENYLWVTSIFIIILFAFIWILIISGRNKKRFLTWKKEKIYLWVYSNEREYSKDDLMQELYDENVRLEKENKILKKKASNSSLWGIIVLCVVIIALWFKRNNNSNPDNTTAKINDSTADETIII